MQGKGIIKFFLVVMVLVCLVQVLYVFPTNRIEREAENYAQSLTTAMTDGPDKTTTYKMHRTSYLDSMSSEVVFSIPLLKEFTYQELKSRQLALGLDLKGGLSTVLQVDLKEFLQALSNDSKDATFLAALDAASAAQANTQSDYVALFADAWNASADGKKLADVFVRNEAMRDQMNNSTSNGEVIRMVREKADEAVDLTFKRLKERIDKFGVTQPNISLDKARDLILIELPGVDNPERAKEGITRGAKLEFWNVYRISDQGIQGAFEAADNKLKSGSDNTASVRIDTLYDIVDNLGNIDSTQFTLDTVSTLAGSRGKLLSKLQLNTAGAYSLAVMGQAKKNDRKTITEMLDREDIKSLFPRDLKFYWAQKAATDVDGNKTKNYELYAIRKERGKDTPPLAGDLVTDASANPDPQTGSVNISLKMNNKGAKIWGQMTTKAAQDNNREIAILLDDEVVSAPRVINPILSGDSSITGQFTMQEGQDLSNILQIGKLPANVRIIQEALVGPSLGQENINRSITSLLIGFGLVFLFMILYYGTGGIVSILALLLNIVFIFGALASFGTVLTLPGIAGIILTIGMAVDANVIIYERIREELREGKSLLASIEDGFANSYSAIIDANVTTLLTAFVLIYFGLGPIKGFAVVLAIGVISSVFTAVLVGRMLIEWWTGKGNELTFWTGFSKNMFSDLKIDWLSKRKIAYMISGTIIGLGIISFVARGFELGIDFKGGYSYNIEFDQDVDPEQIRAALSADDVFGSTPIVKAVDTDNTYNVTTSYLIDSTDKEAAKQVMDKLYQGISTITTVDKAQFIQPDGVGTHVSSSSKVGPTIADDIRSSAFWASAFALLLIFLYIFIRFSKWQYSAGAVAALAHDTVVVLALFSLGHGILPFSLEIDQNFIAAILTVIGYSINDTVVVFDRIREFMNTYIGKTKHEIINMAINSTVSRTVITSLTTLFVIAILFVFGGSSIKGFAFALLVGVIVGTYSSIFVATPIMSDLTGDLKPKESKKKRSFSRAVK